VTAGTWLIAGALSIIPQDHLLHIQIVGTFSADQRAGFELALDETMQTAQLLGARVTASSTASPSLAGLLVASTADLSSTNAPAVYLGGDDTALPSQSSCTFRIQNSRDDLTWHSTLRRYGASELNDRFARRFGRPMTGAAWNAWFAVKAIVESALRAGEGTDLCRALVRRRFDGHKGSPLFFDADTHVLQQPLYEMGPDGNAREKK
jgi:hypothetical protein